MSSRHLTFVVVAVLVVVAGLWWMLPSGSHAASAGTPWQSIASTGVTFTTPAAWTLHDPFTSSTPYYFGRTWLSSSTPHHFHQAVLVSEAAHGQIFLIRGNATEVERELDLVNRLEELTAHPLVEAEPNLQMQTADGVAVHYGIARMAEGLLAGDAVTYFIGVAYIGDEILVVNGGGLTGYFDPQTAVDLVSSLRVRPQ